MSLEGLISVCTKIEPASSKNNEILELNVLQKFTSHALLGFFSALPRVLPLARLLSFVKGSMIFCRAKCYASLAVTPNQVKF